MDRTYFLLLLLALVIVSGIYAYRINQPQPAPGPADDGQQVDYFMDNFSTLTMNPDGSARNRLSAEQLVHYANNNQSQLTQPRLELFQPDKPPTIITAEKGWIMPDNDVILLSGIVALQQLDANGELELKVDTSEVKILLSKDYAETAEHAVITGKRSRTESDGLRVYMNQQRVELLNNVRAKILPKPQS